MGTDKFIFKIQTYIKGQDRKDFELDMSDQQMGVSELARDIIRDHYKRKRAESKHNHNAFKSKYDRGT